MGDPNGSNSIHVARLLESSISLLVSSHSSGDALLVDCSYADILLFFSIDNPVKENGRPDIDQSWPQGIQTLLKSSFDADMAKRPVS